ncbi:DUF262 domain-containing protein [Nostoc sp. CHAB 5834]|nr:DUF262 domain-containing protein [Nostoc sp. CHAB 5834]
MTLFWNAVVAKVRIKPGAYLVRYAGSDFPESMAWYSNATTGSKGWRTLALSEGKLAPGLPLEDNRTVSHYAEPSSETLEAVRRSLLGHEGLCEEVYRKGLASYKPSQALGPRPPSCRTLVVGQAVKIGALSNCEVAELRDDGRFVIAKHSARERRDNLKELPSEEFQLFHWTEVLPASGRRTGALTQKARTLSFLTTHLDSLIGSVHRGLDDSPDFQRGYVWSDYDREQYLTSVFEGRDLGRFIFVRREWPLEPLVLDGKQRLDCLSRFVRSEISWRGVFWHQLSGSDISAIYNRTVQQSVLHESDFPRAELLKIFLEVNASGVPQTEAHLQKVRQLLELEVGSSSA